MKPLFSRFGLSLFLLGACSALTNCSDNVELPNQADLPLLKITFDSNLNTTASDDYIILYRESGAFLEMKPIESGQSVSFDNAAVVDGEKITFARFNSMVVAKFNQYSSSVFMGVAAKSDFTFYDSNTTTPSAPTPTGKYQLTVNNTPSNSFMFVTDKLGDLPYSIVGIGGQYTFVDVPIRSNGGNHLLVHQSTSEGPRYKWIENPTNGSISFPFSDLQKFDKELSVSFPTSLLFGTVKGFETTPMVDSYLLFSHFGMFSGKTTLGFLNRFSNYSIVFNGGSMAYSYFGPALSSFPAFNWDKYSIADKSISTFKLATSEAYLMRTADYNYYDTPTSTTVYVEFTAPPGDFSHPIAFPAELLAKYPKIDMTKLVFEKARVVFKGNDYSSLIQRRLGKSDLYTPHERATLYVN